MINIIIIILLLIFGFFGILLCLISIFGGEISFKFKLNNFKTNDFKREE